MWNYGLGLPLITAAEHSISTGQAMFAVMFLIPHASTGDILYLVLCYLTSKNRGPQSGTLRSISVDEYAKMEANDLRFP